MRRTRITALALSAALATFAGAPSAYAQSPEDNQAGAQFQAGQKALANGKYRAAVGHFGKVLRSPELKSAAVAKALYMRGVAHEKAGQPAQAIADITSALYLSGLTSAERAKAYLSRGKAYEAVGMNDLARADISRARSGGVSDQQIARAPQTPSSSGSGGGVPTFATSVASSGSASPSRTSPRSDTRRTRDSVPTFATSSQTAASPPAPTSRSSNAQRTASLQTRSSAPAREEQIPQFRTSILPQETRRQTQPQPRAQTPPPSRTPRSSDSARTSWDTSVAQQQSVPAPAPAQSQDEESGTRVGRWFRGLRENVTRRGDTQQTAAAPAATQAAPPPPTPAASAPPQWQQTTSAARAPAPSWSSQVSTPSPARRTAAAPQAAAPAAAPRTTTGGGGYRIQLAALRSDAEAQATWKRLQAKHGALLGSYQPNIVKTDLGGLGTFYRVQLGPFADKAATQQLCRNFKSGGLDCFLLAQ